MSDHREHFENDESISSTQDEHRSEPSAPPASSDDNGYIVVQDTPVEHLAHLNNTMSKHTEEINQLLADVTNGAESALRDQYHTVVAEADSSVARDESKSTNEQHDNKQDNKPEKPESGDKKQQPSPAACSLCPYYLLACDYFTKMEVDPKVKDLLLWKCPKLTGAVFGTLFVLLLSLSLFSLFTVVSSLALTTMAVIGAYRFYLALIFRIKGTYDNTFDKLSNFDVSFPKDKIQELARLLDSDMNKVLNKIKSILLWDNVTQSVQALVAFYFLNIIGSCFNTLTLLILVLVSVFTLPKVYQVYKKPIDQGIEKVTSCAHNIVKQVLAKLPVNLNKKKTQ